MTEKEGQALVFVVFAVIGLIVGVLHIRIRKQPRKTTVADVLLFHPFAFRVGLGELLGLVGHT